MAPGIEVSTTKICGEGHGALLTTSRIPEGQTLFNSAL